MTGTDSGTVRAFLCAKKRRSLWQKEENAIQTEDKTGKSEPGKIQSKV